METKRRSCPDEMTAYEGWENARPFRVPGIGGDTCCHSDQENLISLETSGEKDLAACGSQARARRAGVRDTESTETAHERTLKMGCC